MPCTVQPSQGSAVDSNTGEHWLRAVASHACREQIIRLQGQVDKQYAGLKEAAEERRHKLENMYRSFHLKREVDDLEQWIAERDVVASSQEMGQDYDHVMVRWQPKWTWVWYIQARTKVAPDTRPC